MLRALSIVICKPHPRQKYPCRNMMQDAQGSKGWEKQYHTTLTRSGIETANHRGACGLSVYLCNYVFHPGRGIGDSFILTLNIAISIVPNQALHFSTNLKFSEMRGLHNVNFPDHLFLRSCVITPWLNIWLKKAVLTYLGSARTSFCLCLRRSTSVTCSSHESR